MRIVQILPTLAYGDAIGNDTIALKNALNELGYETAIYAENIGAGIKNKIALSLEKMPKLTEQDVIIYHLSTGTVLNEKIAEYSAKKIIMYHNVTPPSFFENYDKYIYMINTWALEGVKFLANQADYCLADSELNKKELIKMGYTCDIDVLPILIPFDDYLKKPDAAIMQKYNDGCTNIIFTGRVVPNKKQEDVIKSFCYYKKYFDSTARLFIVGSFKETDTYYQKLQEYVYRLGVKDVFFTGHIRFDEILAYYKIADLFLCLSEHEGFCVPLVESMIFDVPIVAYNSSAIPSTLGGAGLLLESKDPVLVAGAMDRVIRNQKLREKIIENQRERLQDFRYEIIKEKFAEYLQKFCEEVK